MSESDLAQQDSEQVERTDLTPRQRGEVGIYTLVDGSKRVAFVTASRIADRALKAKVNGKWTVTGSAKDVVVDAVVLIEQGDIGARKKDRDRGFLRVRDAIVGSGNDRYQGPG